jgi:hypothetical protein
MPSKVGVNVQHQITAFFIESDFGFFAWAVK